MGNFGWTSRCGFMFTDHLEGGSYSNSYPTAPCNTAKKKLITPFSTASKCCGTTSQHRPQNPDQTFEGLPISRRRRPPAPQKKKRGDSQHIALLKFIKMLLPESARRFAPATGRVLFQGIPTMDSDVPPNLPLNLLAQKRLYSKTKTQTQL